jgi:formate dehydrogenase alpha subunit
MTNSINEIIDADTIFIIGSNTTENHPVIGAKIRQAKRKGASIIVADPRDIELAKDADVYLQIKPGTNIALMNGMMNVILEEGLQDKEFIAERTENFEEMEKVVKNYTPEKAASICGVDAEDIRKAARLYAKADKASIVYCMGITQHTTGTNNVMSTANLALLCGNFGKDSVGVNPLRGQNNVQGACDMGALPVSYPAYQPVTKPEVREKFEKAWGVELSPNNGMTIPEMMDAAGRGDIKFLYIMGENPMVSDPDINHVKHALEHTDFVVVQDIFMTETAAFADVILPAAVFAEKDGTFSNTERRVQRVRKAVEAPGKAKADWVILYELMKKLGYYRRYKSPADIMAEIATVAPSYAGIDYDRLEEAGIQWPCPTKDHPGTKYLHKGTFSRGKGLFSGIEHKGAEEQPDEEYPFVLTTGRVLYHYHTGTMSRKVKGLNEKVPGAYVEISPTTAEKLGVSDGEMIQVSSRRGSIKLKAKLSSRVKGNVVFVPFHFAEAAANTLTNSVLDPKSKIPEFKVCAVAINK